MVAERHLLREFPERGVAHGAVAVLSAWVIARGELERGEAAVERKVEQRLGREGVQVEDREAEGEDEVVPAAAVV